MRWASEGNIRAVTPDGAAPLDVGPDLLELVGRELTDWNVDHAVRCGYRLESILGAGGMGVAFLARVEDDETSVRSGIAPAPPRPGRPLAGSRCVVKVLLPQVVARESRIAELSFKKEVVALSRLADKLPPSPFVVRYLDAGLLAVRTKESGLFLPWCVIEHVDGRPLGTTLDERLREACGPLEPARAASLIDGILRGVRAVHAVGLVHRDLKPSNVLVCGEPPNELPKITDFGVARALGVGDTFDVTVGTTGYAALEQLEGPSPKARPGGARDGVGPWSDVFALGAILYEIIAREAMYEAPSAMAFVGKVLARNFDRLAERAERGALGAPWSTAEGRALAARWDELLLRATSPRSPGGGTLGEGIPAPLRHRDVDELLDDVEPLLDAMRVLGATRSGSRPTTSIDPPDSPSKSRASTRA
jgi:serine/threonine protein kinase